MKTSHQTKASARKPWFRAKSYGWGWTPVSWEGWTVLGVWVALVGGSTVWFNLKLSDSAWSVVWPIVIGLILTGILLVITYRTGEPPAWHWGPRD